MWYKIDFQKLIRWLMPPILRRSVILAMLEAMIAPIREVYASFMAWRGSVLRRLGARGSADIIERMVNEDLGMPGGVQILSENNAKRYFLWWKSEDRPPIYIGVRTSAFYLKNRAVLDGVANFVVRIPTSLCTDLVPAVDEYKGVYLSRIIELVEFYKPAGRKYRIELY